MATNRVIISNSETVPPRVDFNQRSLTDKWFGLIYILSYIGFLSTGFFLVSKVRPAFYRNEAGNRVISDYYLEEAQTCCNESGGYGVACYYLDDADGARRLSTNSTTTLDGDEGIFDAFLEAPEIIIGLLLTAFGAGILWILALRFYAKQIVILSEISKIGIAIAMGVYQEDTTTRVFFFLIAAAMLGYAIWARNHILFAAKMISHSTIAMKENPSLLGASLLVKCVFAANAALFVYFVSESMNVQELDASCNFVMPKYVGRIVTYLSLSYLWTIFLLDTVRLSIIATIVGSWHFHPQDMPSFSVALKNVGSSFGSLSIAALISTIAEKLNRMASEKSFLHLMCLCINPIHLCFCLFSNCVSSIVKTFTKFSVILHVFTGKNFLESAKSAFKILSRHFVGGYVTDATSKSVLFLGSYAFSIGLGMAAWAWLDDRFDCGTLSGQDGTGQAYLILWVIAIMFNIYYPVLGIYIMILVNQLLRRAARSTVANGGNSDNHIWVPPMAGIFVGSVSMMFFMFLSKIFIDTIDTLFLCFAIDKDNNVDMTNEEFSELVKNMPNYTEVEVVSDDGSAEHVEGQYTDHVATPVLPPPTAPVVAVPVTNWGSK